MTQNDLQTPFINVRKAVPDPFDEIEHAAMPFIPMRFDETTAKRRSQRQRHKAGNKNRRDYRYGKFVEQPAENTAHEQHRNKDSSKRQGHGQNGETDFVRTDHRGLEYSSSHFDVTDNVLEHHNRVVDNEAD